MHQLTLPLFNALPQYCTQVGYSNPTGSQIFFLYIRALHISGWMCSCVNGTFLMALVLLCGFLLYSADG